MRRRSTPIWWRASKQLGYRAYRLLPGLGLLAPFDGARPLDPFMLNLFGCRDDRAQLLERRGLLARAATLATAASDDATPAGAGLTHLRAQLFAAPLWPRWSGSIAAAPESPHDRTYALALDTYAVARRITEPPARRVAALLRALDLIRGCARDRPTLAVWQSCARIAWEAGERALAVQALSQIVERCVRGGPGIADAHAHAHARMEMELETPFLAVSPRFDDICRRSNAMTRAKGSRRSPAGSWPARSSSASGCEHSRPSTPRAIPRRSPACMTIEGLGYQSPEMARRLELVKRRLGR